MNELERYRHVCPAASTFSKDIRCWAGDNPDFHPQFIVDATDARVWGNDHRAYLDWVCALGAIILGYGNWSWNKAMIEAHTAGGSFSLPHIMELEVAEKLVNVLGTHVPSWSPDDLQVRFLKTGSECTEAAVRLARAVTGRNLILRCSDSYLGWGDAFIATTPPGYGIPPYYAWDTVLFKYGQDPNTFLNDDKIGELNHVPITALGKPACIILEQGLTDPPEGWYGALRVWCDKSSALLILDETASGFRYGLGGAAERFNIMPDLACYGKALGNGAAIAALVGRREYISWFGRIDPVFVSGTFFGELFGLYGASAVLDTFNEDSVKHLQTIGGALKNGLTRVLLGTGNEVVGHDVRHIIKWASDEWHAYLVKGLADNGILMNRPNYSTLAHNLDDVKYTVDVVVELVSRGLPEIPKSHLPRVLFQNR